MRSMGVTLHAQGGAKREGAEHWDGEGLNAMASLAEVRPRMRVPQQGAPVVPLTAQIGFSHSPAAGAGNGPDLRFTATLITQGASRGTVAQRARAALQAAPFLTDIAYGAVPLSTLARLIGCFALSGTEAEGGMKLDLTNCRRERTSVEVGAGDFEVEITGFGTAHILHEDDALGLYILEIAPGASIPAHSHRVMREWELILDEGLLQQDQPVARGAAFAWPLGHVHAYRNPTARPLRILCVDSPRFDPSDEVPLIPVPPLAPLAPFAEYPA